MIQSSWTTVQKGLSSVALSAAILTMSGLTSAAVAQDDISLVVARDMDLNSLDPARAFCDTCQIYLSSTYDRLVDMAEDNTSLVPMLAREWSSNEDQTVFTFKLDPAARFSDGSPVEAKDVKWSLERLDNIKGGISYLMDPVTSIEAPDASTVVITVSAPNSEFVGSLSAPYAGILNSDVVTEHGGNAGPSADSKDTAEDWLMGNSAGAGPYTLVSYSPGNEFRLTRNENYWRKAPQVKDYIFRQTKDAVSQVQMLQSGNGDIAMNVDPITATSITGSDIEVVTKPSFNMVYVALSPGAKNLPHPLTPKIREAIAKAIDYDSLIEFTLEGQGSRLGSPLPNGFPGAGAVEPIAFDLEGAKALMEEEGVADGFTLEAIFPNVNQYGVDYTLMMQKIQMDLAKINVDLDLGAVEFSVWRERLTGDGIPMTAVFFAPDYYGSSQYVQYFAMMDGTVWYGRAGGPSDPSIANPKTPEIFAQALAAGGEESNRLFGELAQIMADDHVILPIVSPDALFVSRKGVSGLRYSACCNLVLADITVE
ncbi:ABC transporter substrate-binding protein [Chachezhania sediminis]|uniref:ABC transporter substrate-binding protein n=1 Tax=Chachezhania sediminis TaxID=2599291 RepID=UPI00131EAD41|nr:ABC transporter substrate-binding protein [Chachezhania sediminis]